MGRQQMPEYQVIAERIAFRKALVSLTESVAAAVRMLDDEMKKPSDAERGARIARITNGLEMANDHVKRFTLGRRK